MEEDFAISSAEEYVHLLLLAIWMPVYRRGAVCFLSLCLPGSLSVLNSGLASLNTSPR